MMKFTINTTQLRRLIGVVSSVSPTRSTMPEYLHTLLTVSRGSDLTLSRFDGQFRITSFTKLDDTFQCRDGAIGIPSRSLESFLVGASGDTVEISVNSDNWLTTIKSARRKVNISCLPPNSFPVIEGPEFGSITATGVKLGDIAKAIASVESHLLPPADTDKKNQPLRGLRLEISNGRIVSRASDQKRAAEYKSTISGEGNLQINLPNDRTLSVLKTLGMEASDTQVSISISEEGSIRLMDNATIKLDLRASLGEYPDFSKITASPRDVSIKFKSADMHRVLSLMDSLLEKDDVKTLNMEFNQTDIILKASSRYGGLNTEDSVTHSGMSEVLQRSISANLRFIKEAIVGKGEMMTEMLFNSKITPNNTAANVVVFRNENGSESFVVPFADMPKPVDDIKEGKE